MSACFVVLKLVGIYVVFGVTYLGFVRFVALDVACFVCGGLPC